MFEYNAVNAPDFVHVRVVKSYNVTRLESKVTQIVNVTQGN